MATTDPHLDSVCIIGAGFAGLITAHTLLRDGFTNVVILTRDKSVGGVWQSERVYPGLQINSLIGELSFSSLEMPQTKTLGDRMTGYDMNVYLETFAARYLDGKIRFETEVVNIQRDVSEEGWLIDVTDKRTDKSEILTFRRLVLCTGGCNTPAVPESLSPSAAAQAGFKGPVFHSMYFRSRLDDVLAAVRPIGPDGRDAADSIVIVGGGKSGQDIAAYLANEGRKVTVVCERIDCYLASSKYVPSFLRKSSRVFSVMSPHITLRSHLERFLHTTWLGSKIVHAFWNLIKGSAFMAVGVAKDSPLRRINSPFWTIHVSDEGVPSENRFHMLANTGKIDLAIPARVETYGGDGKTLILKDGSVLRADAVILATGYSSSWNSIFDKETSATVGLERRAPTSRAAKYHWDYTSLAYPPPAHPDAMKWITPIYRGIVPAKNIALRDLAINGAVYSGNYGMVCEVSAHWISSYFLGDKMRIPETAEKALEATERQAAWIRQRYPDTLPWVNESYTSSVSLPTWPQTVDDLLEDLELPSMRSGGNWLTWWSKPVNMKEISMLKEERDTRRHLEGPRQRPHVVALFHRKPA
ncbi:FAD/NAD-P-binding domain-containing protein [Artomyces pyxidatus]|uniref:FAD/NAD-P-binding domain-containing protein n=1 Tax=Artomyces pyxidatus TaxID=48021 RepID=A0ACB8SK62_9AGAM|nr:FAD/NAD-P-binding domain-containing protein [Artomyces pyxidatus]